MMLAWDTKSPGESLDNMAPNVPNGSERLSDATSCLIRPWNVETFSAAAVALADAAFAWAVRLVSRIRASLYCSVTFSNCSLNAFSCAVACSEVVGAEGEGAPGTA